MGSIPAHVYAQMGKDVVVEAYEGSGAYGPVYAAPATVRCLVEDDRRMVRDDGGREVISETTLYGPLSTVCPPESRVTLPASLAVPSRVATVIVTRQVDGGSFPVPSHLEVSLT